MYKSTPAHARNPNAKTANASASLVKTTDAAPPSRYDSEFVELKRLGRGGFGTVLKVRNKLDGKEYAVKRIRFHYHHGAIKSKLLREVQTLALLSHPNIVRYHVSWIEHTCVPTTERAPRIKGRFGKSADEDDEDEEEEEDQDEEEGDSEEAPSGSDSESSSDEEGEKSEHSSLEMPFQWDPPEQKSKGLEEEDLSYDDDEDDGGARASKRGRAVNFGRAPPAPSPERWSQSTLYIQMQLYEDTLANWLQRPRRVFCRRESLDLFRQIATALEYIHAQGVIHRDLKPANIFLSKRTDAPTFCAYTVHVGDFGLATFTQGKPQDQTSPSAACSGPRTPRTTGALATSLGSLCPCGSPPSPMLVPTSGIALAQSYGTPVSALMARGQHTTGIGTGTYVSPEQRSKSCYDAKTDIYSLGLIMLELCVPPFATQMERYSVLSDARAGVLPVFVTRGLPEEADAIRRCLREDPAERPTASQLLELPVLYSDEMLTPTPGAAPMQQTPVLGSPGCEASVTIPRQQLDALVRLLQTQAAQIAGLEAKVHELADALSSSRSAPGSSGPRPSAEDEVPPPFILAPAEDTPTSPEQKEKEKEKRHQSLKSPLAQAVGTPAVTTVASSLRTRRVGVALGVTAPAGP